MNKTYVVTVTDSREKTTREIKLDHLNPMEAHKAVYMSIGPNEEIECMKDASGSSVFTLKKGFITIK